MRHSTGALSRYRPSPRVCPHQASLIIMLTRRMGWRFWSPALHAACCTLRTAESGGAPGAWPRLSHRGTFEVSFCGTRSVRRTSGPSAADSREQRAWRAVHCTATDWLPIPSAIAPESRAWHLQVHACCFKEQRGFGEDGNMISDRRLLIVSTQPQLGNNSERPSVGKGGKLRLEKDGMTECRKGWEDSRE